MTKKKQFPRRSYDVLAAVINRGDALELARSMSRSPALIRAWTCEPPSRKEIASGRHNPLDCLKTLIMMVKEDDGAPDRAYPIGEYIARLLNGLFIPVMPPSLSAASDMLTRLSAVLKETAEVMESCRKFGVDDIGGYEIKAKCLLDIDKAIVSMMQLKMYINPHRK